MAFVNSSGFAGLTDTPLARVGYAKKFVRRFFCNGMIPDITYSDYDAELVQCNQIVQFTKQPIVRWKPYQKNQDLIPQEVDLDNFCFELCEADYVSIKIDTMDEKYLCERFKEWEASVMLSVQQDKEQRLNRYVLGRLPLQPLESVEDIALGRLLLASGRSAEAARIAAEGVEVIAPLRGINASEIPLRLLLVEALRAAGEAERAATEQQQLSQLIALRAQEIPDPALRDQYLARVELRSGAAPLF